MLQMLVVTMREGMEAFLIVAITAAYLKKTGRVALLPAVWLGTTTAILASIGAALLLQEEAEGPLWESVIAAIAAVLVASLTIYMWRAARHMRVQINERMEREAAKPPGSAWLGIFAFTLLMIMREGVETAFIIRSLAFQSHLRELLWGAVVGLLIAGGVAWAWTHYAHRVNLARFFQVTAVFLLVFVIELFISAFHELFEANVLPGIDNARWHAVTEPYSSDGVYGQWLTYAMVALPLAWLAFTNFTDRRLRLSRRSTA